MNGSPHLPAALAGLLLALAMLFPERFTFHSWLGAKGHNDRTSQADRRVRRAKRRWTAGSYCAARSVASS